MAYQLELFDLPKEPFKTTADELKVAILKKYIYEKKYDVAATEVHYCDIIISNLSGNPIIEIETKISFNDFLADFDKEKHKKYLRSEGLVPDYYFFGIPSYLEKQVVSFLKESSFYYYGVLVVDEFGVVTTVKKAKRLPSNNKSRGSFKDFLIKRATRQLLNFYEEKNKLKIFSDVELFRI